MTKGRFTLFTFLLIISVILAFVYYNNFYYIDIPAQDLAHAYTQDVGQAEKEFLDKKIAGNGQVKAFYKLLGTRNVLELKTYEGDLPIICYFIKNEDEYAGGQLREGQYVTIKGKCLGTGAFNITKGVKIEVSEVIPGEF